MSQGAFGHLTYSLGAEFRPNASVLLRGKYGTGFKAPSLLDYFEPSSDYFAYVDEYVGCKNDGSRGDVHDEDCNSTELRQVPAQYVASVNLKPTISKAWSYGVVWSPNDLLVASVDYQHLNITNEIRQEDPATLSNQEMLCRTHAIDIHSPTCTEALAEVIRTPITSGSGLLGPIKAVHVRKINVADESNNSIMASAKYTKPIGAYGQLVFQGSYANVLGHRQRLFPGEPVNDLLRAPAFSSEYKTRMNASVGWKHAGWNVNLTMLRDGAKPNAAAVRDNGYTMEGDGKLPAFVTYNASVTWLARRNLSLSFVINNVCNTQPSFDRTETYDLPIAFAAYGSYGRSYLLTAQYRFVPGHQ